jgi:two-component system response regulator RegA
MASAIYWKVLVVEDDAELRSAIAGLLGASGHVVSEADGVKAATEAFRSIRPDVVLLDHGLVDGDAFDLLRELPRIDPRVPIVVLTGRGSIDLAVRAMKAGASHFLAKPVQLPDLAAVLEEAVEERQRLLAGGTPAAPAEEEPLTLRELERRHILRALYSENSRVVAAARRLGIPRSTLYQKLKDFGIPAPRARRRDG